MSNFVPAASVFLSLMMLLYRIDMERADRRGRGRRSSRGGLNLHVGPSGRSHAGQRNRRAVRAIEEAIAAGRDLATLPDAKVYFDRVAFLTRIAEKSLGRTPLQRDVYVLVRTDPLLRGLSFASFGRLMDCASGGAHRSLTDAERQWLAERRPNGSARRHVNLSLRFLPAVERERYRHEWEAEMAAMSPAEADAFARGVLRSALKSGLVLRLRRILGRLAA
ncbi:hypothetical protein [Streptomyces sp. DH8]|uniref:hypothetical protein n=1 Tax=Streptomyces sp. DH8 TaxID=2857008 RepID=UPI001E497684|nr:hypothetical protein [Streptomyces sp. DH8]